MWKRRIARLTCSTRRHLLPLLPSGPDGVRNPPLHRARLSVLGGERGIRTPVGACGPQIDFESIPLRPLRYLSGFFAITRQRRCTQRLCIIFWRRERDSNPRYTFVGVHTISSRAPSATQTSLRSLFNCRIGFYPLFLKKSTQNFPAFLP